MEFRQLEYFAAVVDAGSVSQAARRLGMSQPPLSLAVSRLEGELGVRLLERTAKGVRPTNAGLYLLAHGNKLIADRDQVTQAMQLMGEGLVGDLRVGVEPMVVYAFMADVVADFVDQAPGVQVRLTDTTPDRIVQGIREGDLDVGCVPFGEDQFAGFVTEACDWSDIGFIPWKLAVPRWQAGERHRHGRGWGRWILPRRMPTFRGVTEVVTDAVSDDEDFEVLEVSTPQTALPFVAAGLGVSPVTQGIGGNFDGVALLDPPDWLQPTPATLLWRKGAEVTPLMQRWIDVTRQVSLRAVGENP
ncbi:LysR family transcriptional regulator [Rhodococcus sp. HNM0569]|uniref:LysR family transcriptional regulator n=1 Tax=Rhodococcus sp. HNM0569 TaxID=2716340 RepID=UPI00146EE996|nr:LysR family transcriptional regulator [Rhodococcus sp. HNM0569]NLU83121.1 LysR family transcriptional regulator [Rhodococcus sp. HNM0569]